MSKENTVTVNLGGWGLILSIIFFVSKIFGYITWSWLWVFSPLWIPIALFLAFFILMCILGTM